MQGTIARFKNFSLLSLLLPFVYGCQGGGISQLGSLFGGSGSGGNAGAGLLAGGEGGAVATIVNPEPASMILLGTGLAAMAYYNTKKKQRTR